MGCKSRDVSEESFVSSSLSDVLLFTTMCIIGHPVEVQVKDGSIYSGIFHTACVEKDYGIVLKKARLTKKGKKDLNYGNGSVIDTLVVLAGDLVQVVAKGILLPADGIVGNVDGDDNTTVIGSLQSLDCEESKLETLKSSKAALEMYVEPKKISQTRSSDQNENKSSSGLKNTNAGNGLPKNVEKGQNMTLREVAAKSLESSLENENVKVKTEEASIAPVDTVEGQVGEDKSQGEENASNQKFDAHKDDTIHEVHRFSSGNAILPQLKSVKGVHVEISSNMPSNGASCVGPETRSFEGPMAKDFSPSDVLASDISASPNTVVDTISQSYTSSSTSPTTSIAPNVSNSRTSAKGFKLNPAAKTFSPISVIPRSSASPTMTTVGNMAYMPNSLPVVPVAGVQPEIGSSPFATRSSLPIKFVQYNNMIAVNGGSAPQYSQPILGHVGSRPQPIRYNGQYNPVQVGPAYVQPNSQAVMVGRLGQLVYVHPVSHDVIQGATTPSQVSVHPLLTPQAQLLKPQGSTVAQAVQLCVTPPPFIAGGQQPFAVPTHNPLSQPSFPATVRPIPVPGANGCFSSKIL